MKTALIITSMVLMVGGLILAMFGNSLGIVGLIVGIGINILMEE